MAEWKDYYDILWLDPNATDETIKEAYRKRGKGIHPDRAQDTPTAKQHAEEAFKAVNEAYEVLIDPETRRKYDAEWLRKRDEPFSPQEPKPRPVATPPSIRFSGVPAGEVQTASFIVQNEGGPYKQIWFSNPDSWVRISDYQSIDPSDELPLQIEIEAVGEEWGKHYIEYITVRLDDQETEVKVELKTRVESKSTPPTFTVITTPSSWTTRLKQSISSKIPNILLGAVAGLVIGGAIVYVLIFHTGGFGPTLGRILVGIGVTVPAGTGIILLLNFLDRGFLWIAIGITIAIEVGVFVAMGVSDFTADLVALGIFTVCSGIGGGIVGYRVPGRNLFSPGVPIKSDVKRFCKALWKAKRIVIPVSLVSFIIIIAGTTWLFSSPPLVFSCHTRALAVSSTGMIAYFSRPNSDIYILSSSGQATNITSTPTEREDDPAWSPDGSMLAYAKNGDIYIYHLFGSFAEKVAASEALDCQCPAWSRDGKKLAFVGSAKNIYLLDLVDGKLFQLTHDDACKADLAWSPDGERMALVLYHGGNSEIYIIGADGRNLTRLTRNKVWDQSPNWSPDGTEIVFCRYARSWKEIGCHNTDIWVMNADGTQQRKLTCDEGKPSWALFANEDDPAWSPDGQKIYFVDWTMSPERIFIMNANGGSPSFVHECKP